MAQVIDRWHLSRPPKDAKPCAEHTSRTRKLVASTDHGKGKRWQVRYRDTAGAQKKENFDKRSHADARAAAVKTDLSRGEFIDRAAGQTTFREAGEQWRASRPHRPNTAKAVRQHLNAYAYPVFGERRLATIRPSDVQAWITGLTATQGLAPSTARTVLNTVRAVFRAAVSDRVIARNPCDGIKPPPVPRKRVQPLTVEHVNALADAMPEPYAALVVAGACTGLRPGELFGLQVRDVDFLRRSVQVERQVQQTSGHGVYVGPPKTPHSHRAVPLPQTAADALAAHLKAYPTGRDGFVFRGRDGGAVARTWFYDNVWRRAVKAAGLPAGTGMHALRHTYASLLIAAGESVKVVSERLGHTNAAMTLNVYSHLFPDSEDKTRRALDSAFAKPSALVVPSVGT